MIAALLPMLMNLLQKKNQQPQHGQYNQTPPEPQGGQGFDHWSQRDATLAKLDMPKDTNLSQEEQPDPWANNDVGY